MRIAVLDHGYVEFVEAWGTGLGGTDAFIARDERDPSHTYAQVSNDYECGIVEAARQSTQGSFRGWEQDSKLLAHLYINRHATPFEFAGMVIEVQAPIFVFREWHRHRTQSYNEASARYAPLPDLNYVPTVDRLLANASSANKQAGKISSADELTWDGAIAFQTLLGESYDEAERVYQDSLKRGVPKELARLCLPVGRYSKMRASANLRNWLAFLTLRMDPAAQWEIRQFAEAVSQIIAEKFPQTWKLFEAGRAA